MAEAAVTFLLENVQKLLVEQMNLISGAEKELKQLQSELELMNAFLIEYANNREKGQVFIQFERQIREAVYEAEDTLDACLTHKAKSGGSILNIKHLNLAKKVKELRLQLQPTFDRAIKGFNALPVADGSGVPHDNKLKKVSISYPTSLQFYLQYNYKHICHSQVITSCGYYLSISRIVFGANYLSQGTFVSGVAKRVTRTR